MKGPNKRPVVKLIDEDGNGFAVMAKVHKSLQRAGADEEYLGEYLDKAMAGDYDHLLGVSMEYIDIV